MPHSKLRLRCFVRLLWLKIDSKCETNHCLHSIGVPSDRGDYICHSVSCSNCVNRSIWASSVSPNRMIRNGVPPWLPTWNQQTNMANMGMGMQPPVDVGMPFHHIVHMGRNFEQFIYHLMFYGAYWFDKIFIPSYVLFPSFSLRRSVLCGEANPSIGIL